MIAVALRILVAVVGTIAATAAAFAETGAALDRIVDQAVGRSYVKLQRSMAEVGQFDLYPTYGTKELRWQLKSSADWTSGFYPGCLWLAEELIGDSRLGAAARKWMEPLEREKTNPDTHDLGFRFGCTYGQALRVAPGLHSGRDREILQTAAATLARRYSPQVGALSSNWDRDPLPNSFPVVIDIMMNLELLLWSAAHGGPAEHAAIARRHADTTLRDFVRADGGTCHVVRYDRESGAVLNKGTLQGAGAETTWSRGQAWAVYGMVVMYRATKERRYLDAALRLSDYFIAHLATDHVSAWDFQSDNRTPDVSATAIVASGLFELVRYLDDPAQRGHYRREAEAMLGALCNPPYFAERADTNCLLDHSTQYLPIASNVDVPAIFADYYFLEAIVRYRALRAAETKWGAWVLRSGRPCLPLAAFVAEGRCPETCRCSSRRSTGEYSDSVVDL